MEPAPVPKPEPKDADKASANPWKPRYTFGGYGSSYSGVGTYKTHAEREKEAKKKEAKAGFERGVTRVEVLYQKKWYKGVFDHSDFPGRRSSPFGIQCDSDKKG